MAYALVIGSKNVSSWSLRPWLALVEAGLTFEEISIRLRQPATKAQILRYSPAGHVPVLIVEAGGGRQAIWDSLAILEFLAETHPEAALWPAQKEARAHFEQDHDVCRAAMRTARGHGPSIATNGQRL